MDYIYFPIIYVLLGIAFGALHVAYISNRASRATQKYVTVTGIWVYSLAIILYLLAVYIFQQNSAYLQSTLMGVACLICLPAALVVMSVATITAGNV